MLVKKRNGLTVQMELDKITKRVGEHSLPLGIDPIIVSQKVAAGVFDGIETKEIDNLLISTSAMMIGEDPRFSQLASRLMATVIEKEVQMQDINSFYDSVVENHKNGILSDATYEFVKSNRTKLNNAVKSKRDEHFEYFGIKTVYDRYLLKQPKTRKVTETPQYFLMRVACGLAQKVEEAVEFYNLLSSHDYMTSTPTLFNSGTNRSQMSSCYLLDSPEDSLHGIYDKYKDVALLSKFAGGIGLSYSKIRASGSLIKGTNGFSNGIIPWLKTLDASVAAVNQGGLRKGAACVYLDTWHADIEAFLELRDNTGDEARRTHNLNLANWIPDLFMKRVDADQMWSLFDPSVAPQLVDLYGEAFEQEYIRLEEANLYKKQVNARALYGRMMKTLAETGNGWMNFKDPSNSKSNQTKNSKNTIHSSNLCTEILEVTSNSETAVCNLGSINVSNHVIDGKFDFKRLAKTAKTAVKYLDRVIDINYYPIESSAASNKKWRPVGLGLMGLQDVFFKLNMPFDSVEARELSKKIQEEIYWNALRASCDLAIEHGAHPNFDETRAADGVLQPEMWGVESSTSFDVAKLRSDIKKHGLRNSLVIAIAPTATIASIVGVYECTEPQTSNLFKRETLSGEFVQVNKYLVDRLKDLGLWTKEMAEAIKANDGSIQAIDEIPSELKDVFRTVWEIPMKSLIDMAADRGAFIDQSQSLNLFMESPTIGKVSSMYMYAWKKGVKTTYYLRSRPATKIAKTTAKAVEAPKKVITDEAAITCSLENPEACESCQ